MRYAVKRLLRKGLNLNTDKKSREQTLLFEGIESAVT